MVYWSLCVVFCCFGHLQTIFLQYLYLFPQAFEAIASSSGGIQTSIDKEIKLGGKIITMKSESDIYKQKGGKWSLNSDFQTNYTETMTPWKNVLDPPDYLSSPSPPLLLQLPRLLLPGFLLPLHLLGFLNCQSGVGLLLHHPWWGGRLVDPITLQNLNHRSFRGGVTSFLCICRRFVSFENSAC